MNHQKFSCLVFVFGLCIFGYVVNLVTKDPVIGCLEGDDSNLPGIRIGKTELVASYSAPDVIPVSSGATVELGRMIIVSGPGAGRERSLPIKSSSPKAIRKGLDRKLPEHGVRVPFMGRIKELVGKEDHQWGRGSTGETFVIE